GGTVDAQAGEQPAVRVLEQRLRRVPWPELVLLGAVVLGSPDPLGHWLRAWRLDPEGSTS
ncbi:MAG: hypothetical protein M3O34_16220, partial [Chloroflexota bacterium]|nr:hypothetical protein [Chloroflexota bacterium]